MARHLIVLKNIKNVFVKLSHPNAVSVVKLNKNVVTESTNRSILSFIVLYIFVFIVGTVIVIAAGSDILTSASSVASCMAGIGPGLGLVGPMGNYAAFPDISKIVLILAMVLGRLEIITAFALFASSFWKNSLFQRNLFPVFEMSSDFFQIFTVTYISPVNFALRHCEDLLCFCKSHI